MDGRRSSTVLDFLSTTEVGRLVAALAEKEVQSEASEELWERREREEERRAEAQGPGGKVEDPSFSPCPSLWHQRKRSDNVPPFCLSFVISLVPLLSWDRPGRRAKESLQRAAIARTARGNGQKFTPP